MSKKNYTTIFIDAEGRELNTDKNGSAIVVCDRMHGKGNNFTSLKVYPPLTDTFTEAQAKTTLAIIKRISAAQFYADENRGASAAEVVAVQEGQKDETGKYIAVYVGDNCKLNRRGDVIDDKGYKADVFTKVESTFADFVKKHTKKSDSSDTGKKPDSSDTGKKSDSSDTGKKPDSSDTGKKSDSSGTGKKPDSSDTGKKSDSSGTGKKSDSSDTGKKSDSSGTGKKSDSSDTGKKSDSSDTGKKSDSSNTGKKPEAHKRFTSDDAIALIDAMWEE